MTPFTGRNATTTERVKAMRFKSPLLHLHGRPARSAPPVAAEATTTRRERRRQLDDNENLGQHRQRSGPEREGPVTIDGAEKGGTVTVLTLDRPDHADRPDGPLLHRHQRRS